MVKTNRELIQEAVSQLGDISEQDRKMHEETLVKIFEEGMLPSEAFGFTKEFMEALYSFGYRLYNTGKYKDAAVMFFFLVKLDPTDARMAFGLGAANHMLKEYRKAIDGYMLSYYLQNDYPIPFYHMCDCYLQLNDIMCAILSLRTAIRICGSEEKYKKLKERSRLMLNTLEEQIANKPPEVSSEAEKIPETAKGG